MGLRRRHIPPMGEVKAESRGLTPAFLFGQLLARTNEGAAGVEPAHANAPRYRVVPGIRPKHYGEKGDRTFFLIMYSGTTWCVSGLFDFEYLHAYSVV